MGKEYITDTVSLRGVQSTDRDGYQTKLSQVTANVALTEGEEQNLPVFSVATTGPPPKEESKDTATTISIGGLVDESSPIQPIFLQTANTIRFYTGEVPDPRAVAYYPGAERLTINSAGRVGINSPETYATLDVREALPSEGFGPGRPRTSSIAITQPFYKSKKGDTTPEFGNIFFRANTSEEEDNPVVYSRISSGNNFQVRNSYEDQRANLEFYTNTGDEERTVEKKHLEINGFEGKTKIFTQLNLSNVPVFRDLKAAMAAGLVNGDVWTDTEGNLKIILGEQDEEQRAKG